MSRPPKWSEAEIEQLRQLFKTKKTTAEIAAEIGRPVQAVQVKARQLGITKNPSNHKDLTERQKLWLRLNYPHIATKICAMILGISKRTCVRRAQDLGG